MAKTIAEINEKIKKGQAVVVTAEEVIDIAKKKGVAAAAKEIDVVTTGHLWPDVLVQRLYEPWPYQPQDQGGRWQGLP